MNEKHSDIGGKEGKNLMRQDFAADIIYHMIALGGANDPMGTQKRLKSPPKKWEDAQRRLYHVSTTLDMHRKIYRPKWRTLQTSRTWISMKTPQMCCWEKELLLPLTSIHTARFCGPKIPFGGTNHLTRPHL